MENKNLSFPIGEYIANPNPDAALIKEWILAINLFPGQVIELTSNLSVEELNWKYRPDGWSIKQLVHHCADSHMNSIIRFKLALTEESPAVRPYFEDRWAELPDSLDDNIRLSLDLIRAIHRKWVILLNNLSEDNLQRTFVHPEHGVSFKLAETIGNYAWHSGHHLAHIKQALEANGKYN